MTDASLSPSSPPLTRTTRVAVSGEQVSADLEGETVILSTSEGAYYGLNRVGSRIWGRLASPVTLGEVLATIVDEFDVDESRAWDDLVSVVSDLLARRLAVRLPDAPH